MLPAAVTRGHPFIVAIKAELLACFIGYMVMHAHGIFIHIRSIILYYGSRNQFFLLAKAIMFLFLPPMSMKLSHQPYFCCWNTVLNTLTHINLSPDNHQRHAQVHLSILKTLCASHRVMQLKGTRRPGNQWRAVARAKQREIRWVTRHRCGKRRQVNDWFVRLAQVGAHNMAAGAISLCVPDTKQGAH